MMQKAKVLIAESTIEKEAIMTNYLKNCDNVSLIGTYNNTNNILNVLKVTDVDILVVDLFMPNFDGVNLLETLANNQKDYKTPRRVIVVTNFISGYVNNRLSALGIDYLLMKPVNLESLNNLILEMMKDNQAFVEDG